MGSGIAGAHARRGIPTLMLDSAPAALEKGVTAISKVIQSRIEIGRATPMDLANALARLSTSLTTNPNTQVYIAQNIFTSNIVTIPVVNSIP